MTVTSESQPYNGSIGEALSSYGETIVPGYEPNSY